MTEIKQFAFYFNSTRFAMEHYPTFFFKVTAAPQVVVAGKEVHFNTSVGQFTDFSQETGITFGYDHSIFVPKIKHIPQHIYSRSLFLDAIQEIYQPTLHHATVGNGTRAQMGIRNEIYVLQGFLHFTYRFAL